MSDNYIALFDEQIRDVFRDALKTVLRRPAMAGFFARTVTAQRRAARRRKTWLAKGLQVPPLLIASITGKCNLHCPGCYARRPDWAAGPELTIDRWRAIFTEADQLGISLIMVAGGEPLTRPEILSVTRDFPHIIFPLFTNGLLLDETLVAQLKRQHHVIPVISLEGFELETDARRGRGVYDRVRRVIGKLEGSGVFLGVSLTVSRRNFPVLTDERFFRTLYDTGCRLFIFVEFTPVDAGTEELTLTHDQKIELERRKADFKERYGGVVIGFPGDEEQYGGCLAAGRGFVHVGPDGSLQPCPFAPFSDAGLATQSLADALRSELLSKIRDGHARLQETTGGCALWTNREWVRSLMSKST
jgi:MoaA/NifB/PqqE/SkfB family radical SAM enzyme